MATPISQTPLNHDQQQMVLDNRHLAFKRAFLFWRRHRPSNPSLQRDDCDQEAMLALMAAAVGYRPETTFAFSTYACMAIHNRLLQHLEKLRILCPSPKSKHAPRVPVTLVGDWFGESAEPCAPAQPDALEAEDSRRQFARLLNSLPNKERRVVRLRFGLGRYHRPHTLRETAERVGVCYETVRAMERRALIALRSRATEGAPCLT